MRFLLATLLLSSLFAPAMFADDAATLHHDFTNLTIGPSASVSKLSVTNGRMKLILDSGTAAPVKAGEQTVGLYFKGSGSFEYTVDDAVERPILEANFRAVKSKASLTATAITGKVDDALILMAGAPLPVLAGAVSEQSLADSFASHRVVFTANLEEEMEPMFVLQKLNAPAARAIRIELRSGDEEWTYAYDDVQTYSESLRRLYSIDFEDRSRRRERYVATISEVPLRRGRADLPIFDTTLTALDYTITASDAKDVAMTIRETIVPRTASLALAFSLFNQIYDHRNEVRSLNVKSVTTANGTKLEFAHTNTQLLVSLPEPAAGGKPIDLVFELEGDILIRPSGDSYWLLRGPWYPLPSTSAATVHGVTKVKGAFVPFAGGKTISRRSEDGYNVLETKIDTPTGYVYVAAGKYHFEEEKRDNVTIRTASYGMKNARAIRKLNALAFDMIAYYEFFLGPFPYDELNIVEINDFGWGQAPAGMIFITQEAFQPLLGTLNQLYSEGINERIAHEIAHQYWGHVVQWPSSEEQWLSESFAEYSAALLLRKFQGDAIYNRLVAHWQGNAKVAQNTAPIPFANRIVTPNNEDWQRVHLLYSKGPLLLAALHKEVGDEMFLTFLKSYQKSFRWKYGTTKDVAGLLGFLTKKDMKPFFDRHYWGLPTPDWKPSKN